jgi:7-cyano-7-deazaguanine reductase
MATVDSSPLGKPSDYSRPYDPGVLFAIRRAEQRATIGLGAVLPFSGADLWTAYELSWLDSRGKPEIALGFFRVNADSPNIVESKSLKLYLNGFSQKRFDARADVEGTIAADLGHAFGSRVDVRLAGPRDFAHLPAAELDGESLDDLPIAARHYTPRPELLAAGGDTVSETLVSNLFKSNCPVTGQPDWGSVQVRYHGPRLDRAGLLGYLVSFRQHGGFHEHCVERMFVEIAECCRPDRLTVYARFTRRGGVDINPFRSNWEEPPATSLRTARQ